jgi:hypothetical protein
LKRLLNKAKTGLLGLIRDDKRVISLSQLSIFLFISKILLSAYTVYLLI